MKKTNNKPTAAELRAWAKAANILGEKEDGIWPVEIPGIALLWIAGPAAMRANIIHVDDMWRPDLYASHVAPVIEALRLDLQPLDSGAWYAEGIPACRGVIFETYTAAACAAIREKLKEGKQ